MIREIIGEIITLPAATFIPSRKSSELIHQRKRDTDSADGLSADIGGAGADRLIRASY